MYTYIITYRFETKEGEERSIREGFRNWITEEKEDGSHGICDETTSTAIYRSKNMLELITIDLDLLYKISHDYKHKEDCMTVFVFNETNKLTAIHKLINKKWEKVISWKELFEEKEAPATNSNIG